MINYKRVYHYIFPQFRIITGLMSISPLILKCKTFINNEFETNLLTNTPTLVDYNETSREDKSKWRLHRFVRNNRFCVPIIFTEFPNLRRTILQWKWVGSIEMIIWFVLKKSLANYYRLWMSKEKKNLIYIIFLSYSCKLNIGSLLNQKKT